MQLKLFAFTGLLAFSQVALAFPSTRPEDLKRIMEDYGRRTRRPEVRTGPEVRDGQVGRIIQYDPVPSFLGTKMIPGKWITIRQTLDTQLE
jgi:hypothetical protein